MNTSWVFPEWHQQDNPATDSDNFDLSNTISLTADYNYLETGPEGATIASLDGNLSCQIPPNLVPTGQTAIFNISSVGAREAQNQPDISSIKLRSFDTNPNFPESNAYEIKTLNPALVDSTDTFINNHQIQLSFFYSAFDADTQNLESENSYKIYRWDARVNKWMLQGGNISSTENKVVFEVSSQGIYTIYRNRDRVRPAIAVKVQDKEITLGGHVSGKGVISLILSDANGIDVYDGSLKLFLNGNLVSPSDYVVTVRTDNVNRVPLKYQLNLQNGLFSQVVDCKDVNGNYNTREMQFTVSESFDLLNVANYPNPVLGLAMDPNIDFRTRFTYSLTYDADEVSIKIYTLSGRFVKHFQNLPNGVGYHEYPRTLHGWDCKDEEGMYLANGTYFWRITAKKDSQKIEKTMKMAILK